MPLIVLDGLPPQDYSLLLGIHIVEEVRPAEAVENGDQLPHGFAAYSFEGPGSYQLGIIDPLQRWNAKKICERLIKIILKCRCAKDVRNGMSAVGRGPTRAVSTRNLGLDSSR